jgi:hypothetical protein
MFCDKSKEKKSLLFLEAWSKTTLVLGLDGGCLRIKNSEYHHAVGFEK